MSRTAFWRPRLAAGAALVVALIAALVPLGEGPAAAAPNASLTRYPYLTDSIQSSITINWATDRSNTSGSVTWGPLGSCGANTLAAAATSITVLSSPQYQWKATIPVAPDTRYCYRVLLGATDLLGSDPSPTFTSQAAAGSSAPFSFAVFGDWGQSYAGSTNPNQANVLAQMAQSGSRFAVMTGDTAYPGGGQGEYGDLQQTGTDVSGVFGPNFWAVPGRSLPVFNVTGNHGFTNGAVQVVNWPEGNAAATSGGRYQMEDHPSINGSTPRSYPSMWYAWDAGGARFYALTAAWADGNLGTGDVYRNDRDAHWQPSSAEYQWLRNDLATHPGSIKFAFWHYPLFADSSGQPGDSFLQGGPGTLQGLLNQYGVNMVFNGHAHQYQRNRADAAGMVSYVVGNSGAAIGRMGTCTAGDLYGISGGGTRCGAAPSGLTDAQVYGFVKVTVSGRQVTVTPTNSLGQSFDVQTYDFGPPPPPDTTAPSPPTSLTATAPAPNQVSLAWTGSTDDVGVTAYRLYRNGSTTALATSTTTTFTDPTVGPNTAYSYQVTAVDAAGNESAPSNIAAVTTPSSAGGIFDFAPTDDTTIDSAQPAAVLGTNNRLVADNSPTANTLLRFDVSGTGGCAVASAHLQMTVGSGTDDKSAYGGDVYATSSSTWSQATATWNNGPTSIGARVASVAGPVTQGVTYQWDVKPLVVGSVVSMMVKSTSGDGVRYSSKEGATAGAAPRLHVVCGVTDAGDTEAPSAPTALVATAASSSRVDLTWTGSTDNTGVTGYRVYRNGSTTPLATSPTATFADTSVSQLTAYSYEVTAVDAAGNQSARSNLAAVTTPASPGDSEAPSTPSVLTAAAPGPTQVDLVWTASADNTGVTGYQVYRNGSTTPLGSPTTTTFSDTSVVPNTAYSYQVTARDAAGNESPRSNVAAVTTPSTGATTYDLAPTDDATIDSSAPTSIVGTTSRVTVDNIPVVSSLFRFDLATVPTCPVDRAVLRLTVGSALDDKSVYGGDVYATSSSAWSETTVNWNNAPTSSGAKLSSVAGSVAQGIAYEWDVKPVVAAGSVVSLMVKSTSGDGARYFSKEGGTATGQAPRLRVVCGTGPVDNQAPSVPTGLTATASSSSRVDLAWTASTDDTGVTGYRLYRNGSTTPLATSPTATFPDTTVAPSTTYAYQVTAVDAAGNESPRSNVASATTPSGPLVVTFAPTDDATIDSSLPTSLFGANVRLTVDNSPVVHSLLKFNVSGLPACSVTSAVLRLTVGSATDDKSVYGGDVYATSSSAWSETTVNWNNGPTSSGAKLSSVAGAVGLNTTYQWDVKPLVAGNGVVSVVLKTTSSDGARYYSKEGGILAQVPQLVVTC